MCVERVYELPACDKSHVTNTDVLSTRGDGQNITYQSYCVCLCTVNDFPRPPQLYSPPFLHPGGNKERIVSLGEQMWMRMEGRGRRDITNKKNHNHRKPTRPYIQYRDPPHPWNCFRSIHIVTCVFICCWFPPFISFLLSLNTCSFILYLSLLYDIV